MNMWWNKRFKKLKKDVERIQRTLALTENPPFYNIGDKVFLKNYRRGTRCVITGVSHEYEELILFNKVYVTNWYEVLITEGDKRVIKVLESELTTKKPKKDGN